MDIQNQILKKYNLFWQYPVITEDKFYEQNKNDPLYIVTYIGNYKGIDQDIYDASNQIPELRDWLTSDQTK